jgi:hypothetical protein
VVGVALAHLALATALLRLGHFGDSSLTSLMNFLFIVAFLGSGFLIVEVVHLDPLPEARQDWLVRPVNRRDLLLAKLLFVVAAVQSPSLAADLMQCLANGFPLRESFAASFSRSVYLFVSLSVPLLALASLTRGILETIAGALAAFAGVTMFVVLADSSTGYNVSLSTGVAWTGESACVAIALLGANATLGLQFFRRKTTPAIWLAATVALACLLTGFMPWQIAFAIQQRRTPHPGAGDSVAITFGRAGRISLDGQETRGRYSGDVSMYLPLRVDGLPDDAVLKADRCEARLIAADGRVSSLGQGTKLEVRNGGQQRAGHTINIAGALYSRFRKQPVRLEIDYSLTLFRRSASYALPALNGDLRTPAAGWCMTRVNESGTTVYATAFLEHVPSGRRNSERTFGHPDYAPYFGQYLADAISRFGTDLPFHDPSELARYPVDAAQLRESQVVLRVYQPWDHFTRTVVIPDIRRQDWESSS